jgi:acetyl-CoA acetyltransferase
MSVRDVDLFEVNEAFAAVVLRFMRHFALSSECVNVNGGASCPVRRSPAREDRVTHRNGLP